MNAQNPLAFLDNYKLVKARLANPLRGRPREVRPVIDSGVELAAPAGGPHRLARHIYFRPIGPEKPRDYLMISSNGGLFVEKTRSLKEILNEVAEEHGVSVLDLKSRRRHRALILARHDFCYRARTQTCRSFPEIGRFLGGKDHTTILHGYNQHKRRLEENEVSS